MIMIIIIIITSLILFFPRGTYSCKFFTESLYFSPLAASVFTSSHNCLPASALSFSTDLLQVVFGFPFLLFPSVTQVIAMLQSLFWSCLSICLIIFRLRYFTSLLIGFISALYSSSPVLTWFCHWICRILRRHLL